MAANQTQKPQGKAQEPAEQPKAQETKVTEEKQAPTEQPKAEEPKQQAAPAPQRTQAAPASAAKSTTTAIIEDSLNRYIEEMAPGKPQTPKSIRNMQVMLFRTLQNVLRQEGTDFTRLFSYVLDTVSKHRKGVFHERFLFRGFDNLTITSSERKNFERILNLIITTCDPKTRSHALKQVDVDATMEGFRDPDMHQRVQEFFTQV